MEDGFSRTILSCGGPGHILSSKHIRHGGALETVGGGGVRGLYLLQFSKKIKTY